MLTLDGPPIARWQDAAREGELLDTLFEIARAPVRVAIGQHNK